MNSKTIRDIALRIARFGHTPKPEAVPLFGKEVADLAGKHGLRLGINSVVGNTSNVSKVYNRILELAKSKTRTFDVDWENKDIIKNLRGGKFKGVILDPTGSQTHSMQFKPHRQGLNLTPPTPAANKRLETSKLFEAQELPGLIPKAVNVMDALRSKGLSLKNPNSARDLHGVISKELASENFILKPLDGAAVTGSKFPTDAWNPSRTAKTLTTGVYSPSNKATYGQGPRKWMAQERVNLEPAPYLDRLANTVYGLGTTGTPIPLKEKLSLLGQSLMGKKVDVDGVGSFAGNNMNEYRLHVVNGKVVPYGSIFRGGIMGALPYARKDSIIAEKEVQRQLDALLPDKYRKGSFGLDVAKKKGGGWQIIETNPASAEGGSSGFLANPQVVDAMHSSVMGKIPSYYNAQRNITNGLNASAKLTAGVGAGYAGVNSLSGSKDT